MEVDDIAVAADGVRLGGTLSVPAGAVGLVFAARRWASRSPARASVEPPPESPYLDRLEQELKETE